MRRSTMVLMAVVAVLVGSSVAATAARTTGFGAWGPIAGTTNDYSTTMQLPATGFPVATVTSDSRADVSVPSGASNWFGENTPPGAVYGSSRDQAYLNLRPRADNATSPSTTVYTFERPTPQGWAFVLGDIDADEVRVSATRADGTPATTAELGFRSAFNLCDTTPRPSTVCASNGRPKDVPTWDPTTATLRGSAGAIDSDGATGWFEPTTSLSTLTFTFTRRAGLPIFQTWFAVAKQTVSGFVGVTSGTCVLTGAAVSLIDAQGVVVATRPVSGTGAYAFDDVAASGGYRVALSGLPDSCITTSPSSRPVDLTAGDVTASFSVKQAIPVPITGVVSASGGALAGVTVTLTPVGGGPATTTTTDVAGHYVFEDNADDTTYTISVTPPSGYLPTGSRTATIPDGATAPVTGQDFVLQALPFVSGVVSGPDGPLAGVTVELVGPGGTLRDVTAADGRYSIPRVPAGTYSLRVPAPPAGYQAAVPASVTVVTADLANQDIVLTQVAPTGSVSGTVTLDGATLAGAAVSVGPAGGNSTSTTTDAQGTFGLGGLTPGSYEIAVARPSGTDGTAARTVTITATGDNLTGLDFAFTTTQQPSPSPVPAPGDEAPDDDPSDPDQASSPDVAGALPDTGGPSITLPLLGLGLVAAGAVLAAATRRRAR